MLLKRSALPVPGPCASRMTVPSSMFQSTSPLISASSPCALSAAIQPRRSPKTAGLRSTAISWGRVCSMRHSIPRGLPTGLIDASSCPAMTMWSTRRRSLALARGDFHCVDDLRIGGAAAEIAREIVPDLILVRIGMGIEQLRCHQQESRRAIAALEGARLDEGLLHRTERLRLRIRERLDGAHLGAVDEGGEVEAAGDGRAVDQHGAAAAHALPAALARAHEIEFALQQLDEVVMRLDLGRDLLAVEGEADCARHSSSPSGVLALARSARNTASALSGSDVRRTPQASSMALAIAGDTQNVAVSPTPLAPNGPFDCWASTVSFSITRGTSRIPGIL